MLRDHKIRHDKHRNQGINNKNKFYIVSAECRPSFKIIHNI